jgi:hypothetical protein
MYGLLVLHYNCLKLCFTLICATQWLLWPFHTRQWSSWITQFLLHSAAQTFERNGVCATLAVLDMKVELKWIQFLIFLTSTCSWFAVHLASDAHSSCSQIRVPLYVTMIHITYLFEVWKAAQSEYFSFCRDFDSTVLLLPVLTKSCMNLVISKLNFFYLASNGIFLWLQRFL